jgi:hypothetical protein
MDATMVARWNEVVAKGTRSWQLGDFAVRQSPDGMAALLDALAGQKHPDRRQQPLSSDLIGRAPLRRSFMSAR